MVFIRIRESYMNYSISALVRSRYHFYAISTWLDLSSRSSVRVITGIINYICPLVSSTLSIRVSHLPRFLPRVWYEQWTNQWKNIGLGAHQSAVSYLPKPRHEEQKDDSEPELDA